MATKVSVRKYITRCDESINYEPLEEDNGL